MTKGTVLITGATQGLGRAIAQRLRDEGWSVRAIGRSEPAEPLEGVTYHHLDVSNADAVATLSRKLAEQECRLGGLVNNAAIQGGDAIEVQAVEEWRSFLDVNVTGAWLMAKYTLPLLDDRAAIVNVGSIASETGIANRAAYCASKHALLGLTRALAVELAPRGIRVNHLTLGSFETPGLHDLAAGNGKSIEDYAARQLFNRLGAPEEAASACAYLLSEQAAFITGTSLTVDGGLLMKRGQA